MKNQPKRQLHWGKSLIAFFVVLCSMPLGHALMILMEALLPHSALHQSAFLMGFVGLVVVVWGVFIRGDVKQTLCGLFGGLLYWVGWFEFLFQYYAQRWGTHLEVKSISDMELTGLTDVEVLADGLGSVVETTLVDGQPLTSLASEPVLTAVVQGQALDEAGEAVKATGAVMSQIVDGELVSRIVACEVGSKPEYLIMPATFGIFIMFVLLYLFSSRTGCCFLSWCQKRIFRCKRELAPRPGGARHTSIVTFLELNVMMWACYLILMFCYDPVFLGERHPVTAAVGIVFFLSALYIFGKQLRISAWGANIRMAIATVVIVWTPIEILMRLKFFKEIWVEPQQHQTEMYCILGVFIILLAWVIVAAARKKSKAAQKATQPE